MKEALLRQLLELLQNHLENSSDDEAPLVNFFDKHVGIVLMLNEEDKAFLWNNITIPAFIVGDKVKVDGKGNGIVKEILFTKEYKYVVLLEGSLATDRFLKCQISKDR